MQIREIREAERQSRDWLVSAVVVVLGEGLREGDGDAGCDGGRETTILAGDGGKEAVRDGGSEARTMTRNWGRERVLFLSLTEMNRKMKSMRFKST